MTLFEKIIAREIPANIVYETDEVIAFRDIEPRAPVHILIVPKKPIPTINDLQESDGHLIGKIVLTAGIIAKQEKIEENGYRLVFNCNKHGGQSVYHIHCHLFGGRQMEWPPG